MSSSKLRKALGAVKDRTSIGLARVGSSDSLSDLDVAIVKATRHVEHPAEERHVREILSLTSYSRAYISSCVNTLSRRLNKTRNWVVALKTLVLIQRLLAEGDPAYEQEIFFATRQGTRLLNLSDFRDSSQSNSWDYSAFVRTYALYLDERLEFRMQGRHVKRSAFDINDNDEEEEVENKNNSTPIRDMKTDHIFSRIQHLQQLLDRYLACRPTGGAKHNRVVMVALYPITKESFQLYYDITEILGILIDLFMELEISDSIKVYDIFCRISKQFNDLDNFYRWCKAIGIARSSEYPEVEKITQKKLDLMDEFIRDKSALAQTKQALTYEPHAETEEVVIEKEKQKEEDINSIKALPPPEGFINQDPIQEIQQHLKDEETKEVDFLNLREDVLSTDEHVDNMALALFDGGAITYTTSTSLPSLEAFHDDQTDWETSLVHSASHLSNQKPNMGGGLDTFILDGMYQQGASNAVMSISGSASSVALGSTGRPPMLVLPAPQTRDIQTNADPFAASLAIAPPPYVQMSDMEKKQKLLMEEQLMWQKYARNGNGMR